MKNNLTLIIIFVFIFFFKNLSHSIEQFNFDVTEILITEDGNKILGLKRGNITTNNKVKINANKFEYNKKQNILKASGNVVVEDTNNNYFIYSENITYYKNKEILFSSGKTKATINNNQELSSEDVTFDRNIMEISSISKSTLLVNKTQFYSFQEFNYLTDKKLLKGKNIFVKENINKSNIESDSVYFSDGFFDLENNNFNAKDPKIFLKKNIFENNENDPRLYGKSSNKINHLTTVYNGIFTSCSKNDKCPPWSIKAKKITHNKLEKKLEYDDAILKVYDVPILYFPKFFHPDPSVDRQSGFLIPRLNNSEILGSSLSIPYYNVISENKDYTFKPTLFDNNNMFMLQNEYRIENKDSSFITDFSLLKNFKSELSKSANSITHFFSKYNQNLNLKNFTKSNIELSLEKVSNSTYLKIFDSVLVDTPLKPKNSDILESHLKFNLEQEKYVFETGLDVYENLQLEKNDRFQFVLPYYNFYSNLSNNVYGNWQLNSKGQNILSNTNNLKSRIINDLNFDSKNVLTNNFGIQNNYSIYIKNLNSLGKKDNLYKNSPQIEFMSIFEIESSLPMFKENEEFINYLTPKISFRTNPSTMKNYYNDERSINADNIFDINRLAIEDTLESGSSLTLGVNFEKNNLIDESKYFKMKLGTIFRDDYNDKIPKKTTINKKNSNIFGTINYGMNSNLNIDYNFALDNKVEKFDYNELSISLKANNFVNDFSFIEEKNLMGDTKLIENNLKINFDENNSFSFGTRRNEKISLTEYYDLVYEYNNDCLTAGIKYKKNYYEDRDLKPTENLLFTITFFPLTTYEQNIDQNLYRN